MDIFYHLHIRLDTFGYILPYTEFRYNPNLTFIGQSDITCMFNLDIRSFFKDVALSIENPLKRTFFALIGLLEDLVRRKRRLF